MAAPSIPAPVLWGYGLGGLVFALGLAVIARQGLWFKARGWDKLILLGPLFYAAPLAAFGSEHFTITPAIAGLVPAWLPWHRFFAYVVGAGFIAGALSLVTKVQTRLAASLLAAVFFLFVALMDVPGWLQQPGDRVALALVLRELAFGGAALAFAGSLSPGFRERGTHILTTIGRYCVAVAVLYYSLEQFLHGSVLAAVPLARLTPAWIPGHALWTYLSAVVYVAAGVLLVAGIKTHAAALWLGATVLLIELAVYVPIGIAGRASLDLGLNYVGDTLMFCGALLLLAAAMPRPQQTPAPASVPGSRRMAVQ